MTTGSLAKTRNSRGTWLGTIPSHNGLFSTGNVTATALPDINTKPQIIMRITEH
jgi:hypothetical protein